MTSSPSIPEALTTALQQAAPHWPLLVRRRWLRAFLPHWRTDLIPEERLARLLTIALRRGWFDAAADARRWPAFVGTLEVATWHRRPIPPNVAVNLFNLAALLPVLPDKLPDALDGEAWTALVATEAVLDKEALSRIVGRLVVRVAPGARRISPILRVQHGVGVHERASRWLDGRWERSLGRLVHLVEPFGQQPWDGVSELGLDGDQLLAWSRPLGLMARLLPDEFAPDVWRGEPVGLAAPDPVILDMVGVRTALRWRGMYAGITLDGAVAFFHLDHR